MPRPVTLFTGQSANLPLTELAPLAKQMGYDGLELACWGDHFDVQKALAEPDYAQGRHDLSAEHDLKCYAISNHLVGQAVCDPIDERHKAIVPEHVWGDGDPEGVRQRAAEEIRSPARAAAKLGVGVVNGFTGSSIWGSLYAFPPTTQAYWDKGFEDFAARWTPILDVFNNRGLTSGSRFTEPKSLSISLRQNGRWRLSIITNGSVLTTTLRIWGIRASITSNLSTSSATTSFTRI